MTICPRISPALLWRLSLTWLCLASAHALLAQTVPSGGVSLVNVADYATEASFYGGSTTGGAVAARTIVNVAGRSFAKAARIDVLRPTGDFWSSALTAPSNRAVANGDVVLIRFFLRAERSTDETGTVFVQVYAEGPAPDYKKSISRQVNAGPEWTEFFLPFTVDGNYAAGDLGIKVGFGTGDRPRTLDLGGFEVLWYGKTRTLAEMPRTAYSYEGREADAPWRAQAAARIDQYRKANYGIRVLDPAGQPVAGARVQVRLRRHAFPFGTAFVAGRVAAPANAADETYRQKLVELFNAGGPENDLKWPAWEGVDWGTGYNRARTLAALEWLRARGFHLRGHVLVWPSSRNLPNSIKPLITAKDPGLPERVRVHIQEIVTATRDQLDEWDVLNEPYDNNDLMTLFGNGIMADWFKEARKHHPSAGLFINEYGILTGGGVNAAKQQFYEDTIRFLLQQGAPVTGIGMQGHFDTSPTGMNRIWSVLERFHAAFPQLGIKITEFDVDTEDEQLQADYTRDFLTMVFSHPGVTGFQMWGFWEGAHWRGRAAMYRTNWEEKPNGRAFRELVHGTWRTDETHTTDSGGWVRGRGFQGNYDVSITSADAGGAQSFTLPAGGADATVTLSPGLNRARLVNLATRGFVGTGGNMMIAGFVVRGGGAKDVVVRGVGPVLANFGVPGVLADPNVRLLEVPELLLSENNDWTDLVAAKTGGLSLENDRKSSALQRTLADGSYTAQLSGVADGTGVALVEIYDAATQRPSRLVNLSTRGMVGTGDRLLIGSFVIRGEGKLKVLIRGVGPGLARWLGGYVANPRLRLDRLNVPETFLGENAGWSGATNAAEMQAVSAAVGAFPLEPQSKDAAILIELGAGDYTVQMSDTTGATGIGLIEVYAVE